MDEIREILEQVARSTQAAATTAEAVKNAVEDKKASTTGWSKLTTKPGLFEHKSQEEEIKAFREWCHGYLRSISVQWSKPGASSYMDC